MSTKNNKSSFKLNVEKPVVEKAKTITEEEAREHFINEVGETPETISETLEKYHNVDAEAEISKLLEAGAKPFEFQEEYFIGGGDPNVQVCIDVLPGESKDEFINRMVEAEAKVFDQNEENFLEKSAEEIESLSIEKGVVFCDEDCICEDGCDEDCVCEKPLTSAEPLAPEVRDAPRTKTLDQMTACEVNIYHKTGILPLL